MARIVHLTNDEGEPVRFSRGQGDPVHLTNDEGDPVYPSSAGKIVWATNPDALPSNLQPGASATRDEFKP